MIRTEYLYPCILYVEKAMEKEQEEAIDSALQSLYNVVKAVPAVALQCLGRFLILFQLVQMGTTTGHLALQVGVIYIWLWCDSIE